MTSFSNHNNQTYKAIVTEEIKPGVFVSSLKEKQISDLPEGEVLIRVKFSGLNYKDALSASGNKGITRKYPHTPGIDSAGTVVESSGNIFKKGDEVIVCGYDLGMNTSGGFAEFIRVPEKWVVMKPNSLSLKECMIIGTSGFTAASAIFEFMKHDIKPDSGKILVTGATGAVGSMAVAMLSAAGYQVVASTGKKEAEQFLLKIGAAEIIDRSILNDKSEKALLPARWMAALDTVGGATLSTVLRSTMERGIVCNCGMLASATLDVSVFPFILRAVRLIGIAAAETPMPRRLEIWKLISEKLISEHLHHISRSISLAEVPEELNRMLEAGQTGKIIVEL
ncbi:MAG: YhdH/YhfP family quinone oxidoreductase [Lentimicrobiaceae bacterium]|nr:YhdH/YhfP family quinone oxidoreductase [Lentimicrobiaceae bacterium]